MFGLFHGLVFLPVFLSILGPMSYQNVFKKYQNDSLVEVRNDSTELPNTLPDNVFSSSVIGDRVAAFNDDDMKDPPIHHSNV